ncbi:helix-turn-helix domain-containing protein [Lacticaseibacillus parakribbianus]|uniref:Rgg family transcriptional regulator n=1 Tax=Lacticaseibacillus parakribbianus TaxID=2970927 RepID=UPI0021CB02DD|nr:helix-turn-helix domain-containing protein [Lacticaseibacillus parakribbianus]
MNSTVNQLGELLFAMRSRRGLTLAAVGVGSSKSAVSRFENGSGVPSVVNAIQMFHNAHGSLTEALSLCDEPNRSSRTWRLLASVAASEDGKQLDSEVAFYEASSDYVNNLIGHLLRGYQFFYEKQSELTAAEIEPVADYLLKNERWFRLEFVLFSNIIYLVSNEQLTPLLARSILEFTTSGQSKSLVTTLSNGFFNASVRAVEKHNAQLGKYLLDCLPRLDNQNNSLLLKYRTRLVDLTLRYEFNPSTRAKTLASMQTLIAFLNEIGAESLLTSDLAWLQQMGVPVAAL